MCVCVCVREGWWWSGPHGDRQEINRLVKITKMTAPNIQAAHPDVSLAATRPSVSAADDS